MPSFPRSPTLRDDELEVRRLVPTDYDAILEGCGDPEIVRWTDLADPFTPDAARTFLEEAARAWYDGTVAELALVVDDRLVGGTHLAFYSDWRASVAYWLAADSRGRGYATRAVRLVTAWGFETFPSLVRIELWSIVGNEASDAVARRAGFTEEGIFRSRFTHRGEYRDVRCFSLLRDDLMIDSE
jgi:RimJ/RimL family protein N-acetyltransferase